MMRPTNKRTTTAGADLDLDLDLDLDFDYDRAFSRNRGLVSEKEQARLRSATVAIAGAGGVGGWHALALARQGVTGFRLVDPDRFEVANFNRQAGALRSTVGQPKVDVLRRMLLDVCPAARIEAWEGALDEANTAEFVEGADLVLDGIDFFALEARRRLFRAARARGVWAMTAGPIGFGAAYLAFSPTGMTFDDYFGLDDGMSREEAIVAFLAGLAPKATHAPYMDLSEVDPGSGVGPSSGAACMMCGALVGVEAVALLTGKRTPRPAPHFVQWDLYRGIVNRGAIRGGARHNLLHRLRQKVLRWHLRRLGVLGPSPAT